MEVSKIYKGASLSTIVYLSITNNRNISVSILDKILVDLSISLGISQTKLKSKSRQRSLVIGKQIFCYVAKKITSESLKSISAKIGYITNRKVDHTASLYAYNRVKEHIECNDPYFISMWNEYVSKSKIYNGNKIDIPVVEENTKHKKEEILSRNDLLKISMMLKRGYTPSILARRFRVGTETLKNKVLIYDPELSNLFGKRGRVSYV